MKSYAETTKEELLSLRQNLKAQYYEFQAKDLELDISRGEPCVEQLGPLMDMVDVLSSTSDFICKDGTDCRNYGVLTGINEARVLLADMMEVSPSTTIIYGNSSLNATYDAVFRAMTHGITGCTPWRKLDKMKSFCPAPGCDHHFVITECFDVEMINVPMPEDGPDTDIVEELAASDDSIRGIWCALKYFNPQGYSYSDETVRRSTRLKPTASDLRIFWDNAYSVYRLYDRDRDHSIETLVECRRAGSPDLVYKFTSASKTSFPESDVVTIATSHSNLEDIKAQLKNQIIGHDKVNQLRHVRFFKDIHGMVEHMRKHAGIIRPKFEAVEEILERELEGLGTGRWTRLRGGYFVSFDSLEGCAKDIVTRCKKAGVVMTSAGTTCPCGKDPRDSNIRTVSTYPTLGNLITAVKLPTLCVKLSSVEKFLKTMVQLEVRYLQRKMIQV